MSLLSQVLNRNGVNITDLDMFMLMVQAGEFDGISTEHKFGRNAAVSSTIIPIASGAVYQTPTEAVTLAAISDDAADAAAGAGAQQLTLVYLDADFALQTATIEMNGTDETTETVEGVLRLIRVYVSRSGTYATQASTSQKGTITVRVASAGATWATLNEIGTSGLALGQSLIGAYTIPAGKTAYILGATITVDSAKTANLYFFKRENANDIVAPYSGVMRVQSILTGVSGIHEITHRTFEKFPEKTDIGFMATAATPADVSVEFELLLIDN